MEIFGGDDRDSQRGIIRVEHEDDVEIVCVYD